jgi:hypothetical protein
MLVESESPDRCIHSADPDRTKRTGDLRQIAVLQPIPVRVRYRLVKTINLCTDALCGRARSDSRNSMST